jgi:hypothetical protein
MVDPVETRSLIPVAVRVIELKVQRGLKVRDKSPLILIGNTNMD